VRRAPRWSRHCSATACVSGAIDAGDAGAADLLCAGSASPSESPLASGSIAVTVHVRSREKRAGADDRRRSRSALREVGRVEEVSLGKNGALSRCGGAAGLDRSVAMSVPGAPSTPVRILEKDAATFPPLRWRSRAGAGVHSDDKTTHTVNAHPPLFHESQRLRSARRGEGLERAEARTMAAR